MGTMGHPSVRTRHEGVLVVWNEPRYFGFIQADEKLENGEDRIFVHRLNFIRDHKPVLGCRVSFELGPPISIGKKDQAARVKVLPSITAGADALGKQGGAA